jgi:hypothetical protein
VKLSAGYGDCMSNADDTATDNTELRNEEPDDEAVQAVVDRVLSYHGGSLEETVRRELQRGLADIGESRDDEWLDRNSKEISQADPAQS